MKVRLIHLWDVLRSSYWFVPSIMIALATGLAIGTVELDRAVHVEWIQAASWVWTGGADGARTLLSAVAGSMITVAGTIFSIMIVVLSLTSSQFGPRLLRNFMRDTGTQVVLGIFTATFIYCLLVLRTVRDPDEGAFVPFISVNVAIGLSLVSLGLLIYFVHHVSNSIQAPSIVANVGRDLEVEIEKRFPRELGRGVPEERVQADAKALPEHFEQHASPVLASESGYIKALDNDALMRVAVEHDLIIRLEHRPGDFVVRGNPLVHIWPHQSTNADLVKNINNAFIVGAHRTPTQDIEFLFRELVEVAMRALSPAINDPFTAMTCLDWPGAALCHFAESDRPSPYRYDEHEQLRVITFPVSFVEMVDTAFNQIRHYGSGNATVVIHMLKTITIIAGHARDTDERAALLHHAKLIEQASRIALPQMWDHQDINDYYRETVRVLEAAAPVSR